MKLYDYPVSGNCYKVRLLLALLEVDYQSVLVDLKAGEQGSPEHLERHPLGKVPVLEDNATVVWDSQAILVYIARRQDATDWLPEAAGELAEVMQWIAFSANEIHNGPAFARGLLKFPHKFKGDLAAAQDRARQTLGVLEERLANHDWLVQDRPTIADIACYPYAALAAEGGVSLDSHTALAAWFKRIEVLPGYVAMPGLK